MRNQVTAANNISCVREVELELKLYFHSTTFSNTHFIDIRKQLADNTFVTFKTYNLSTDVFTNRATETESHSNYRILNEPSSLSLMPREKINIRFRQNITFPYRPYLVFVDFHEKESGLFLQRALLAVSQPSGPFNMANYAHFYARFPTPELFSGNISFITPGSYFNIGDTLHTVTQTELTNNLHDDCRDINLDFTPKLDVIPAPAPAISWDNPRVIARLTNNKVEAREDSYGRTAVSFDWEQA